MTTSSPAIEQYPDIAALRLRYERVAETPTIQVADGLTFLAGLFLVTSPWVAGFTSHSGLAATNLMSGITFALLALGARPGLWAHPRHRLGRAHYRRVDDRPAVGW